MNLTNNKNLKTMAVLKNWTAVAIVMIVFLSSCRKNDPVNQVVEPYTFSKDYTVNYKDWKKGSDDSGIYFYRTFSVPDLTQYIFDNGTMQSFRMFEDGRLYPLPFNDYWIDNTGFMYTEQITCEFLPGQVTFIVKASDHNPDFLPTFDDYYFNVRFLW